MRISDWSSDVCSSDLKVEVANLRMSLSECMEHAVVRFNLQLIAVAHGLGFVTECLQLVRQRDGDRVIAVIAVIAATDGGRGRRGTAEFAPHRTEQGLYLRRAVAP